MTQVIRIDKKSWNTHHVIIEANWWQTENAQDRIRFKQLVYKDGLKVSRSGKVLTPQLSPAYRYEKTKIDVRKHLFC